MTTLKRKGEMWSKREEEELLQSLSLKKDIHNIALEHQRTDYAINMRINYMIQRMHQQQRHTIYELSTIFNKKPQEIQDIIALKPTEKTPLKKHDENSGDILRRLGVIEDKIDKMMKKQTRLMKLLTPSNM